MLRALQADVNAWPQRVKEAGVTNAGGAAYVPVARNLEILRTPDDPEATYAYMRRAWEAPDAESGSAGWDRVIAQAGPRATWEWLMAEPRQALRVALRGSPRAREEGVSAARELRDLAGQRAGAGRHSGGRRGADSTADGRDAQREAETSDHLSLKFRAGDRRPCEMAFLDDFDASVSASTSWSRSR